MSSSKALLESIIDQLVNEALAEKAPKGWEKTVKAMKKHKDITNPWALANYMKSKGYHSHKEDENLDENASALYEKHIGFKNLVKQLVDKGHSEESAKKIAYHIGVKKYGAKKMHQAAAKHKPLSDKEAKKETAMFFNEHDAGEKQHVLRTMVNVLRSHPEYRRMSPEQLADDFVENVPEITDSEEIGPLELQRLAAMALKLINK